MIAHRTFPKGPSRLAVKMAKATSDAGALVIWRSKVFQRDAYRCRWCQGHVMRSVGLTAYQAQAHHLAPRAIKSVRYDVRNGLTLDANCHERLTGKVNEKWIVVGTKFFTVGRQRFIDGDHPVTFQRIA